MFASSILFCQMFSVVVLYLIEKPLHIASLVRTVGLPHDNLTSRFSTTSALTLTGGLLSHVI